MKKLARPLALAMMLCLLLSIGSFASGDPSGAAFAQLDETHWAGSSLTVKSVEIDEAFADYVDATQFCNISKIVYDGGEIAVDNSAYTAILTVDGVQYDLYNAAGETFTGDVVITLAAKGNTASQGNAKFGDDAGSLIGAFAYTAAAYYDEDGLNEDNSVAAAQGGAVVTDSSVSGMDFKSEGDYFSAVYAASGEMSVTDSTFSAFGKGGDDFTGQGCVVIATGKAAMTIDNCVFTTGGALRSAIWVGSTATADITNTVVQSYNDTELVPYTTEDNYATPMMQQVPFALGLTGNIRATLLCGQGTMTFKDSLIASNGWAVLSTDSGSGTLVATDTVALVGYVEEVQAGSAYDETYTVSGTEYGMTLGRVGETSGYIAYCDGFTDYAYGGRWFAPDYLVIMTGGSVTVGASETARFYGWCDRIAFMSHQTNSKTLLDVSESDFDVADTFCMIKSKGGNGETVNLTDVSINLTGENAWSGNLLQVIDSDDLGGGPGATTFTVPYGTYDEYLAAAGTESTGVTTLNITDSKLAGNIYDSVGSQTGSQTTFKNDSIAVNLVNSELTGVVSSSYGVHCDENGTVLAGTITVDSYGREGTYDYLAIGRILNYAAPTVNNPVSMTLTGSTWTCTGLSYIASLTVDADSVVNGDVYVNGALVKLAAGTYENVVVVPAGADYAAAVADAAAAIEAGAASAVVPADMSSLVANTDMGSGGASGEAS